MVVYTFQQHWEILRHYFCRFWQKKKSSFQIKLILILTGTYIEKPPHPKRVTVWCEFCSRVIIGPFFFESEQGDAVIVNADRYRAMWRNFCSQKLPHSRSYTRSFARCFWKSHYQPQSWCRLVTVGLLFVWCRQS